MKTITIGTALIAALAMSGCEQENGTAAAQETERAQTRETSRQQRETQTQQQRAQQQQQQQQQGRAQQQQTPRNLTAPEIAAVLDLVNSAEIREARLAREQARSAEVRQFAEQMLRDHTQAQDRHRQLTRQLNITPREGEVTQRMQREGQTALENLRAARGEAFDRAYIDAQVREHQDAVALLDANMSNVQEREYRDFLQTQRRTIDNHRQMAERIQTTLQPRASR